MSVGLVTHVPGEVSLGGCGRRAGEDPRILRLWVAISLQHRGDALGKLGPREVRFVVGVCAACIPDDGFAGTMARRNQSRENSEKAFTPNFREDRGVTK